MEGKEKESRGKVRETESWINWIVLKNAVPETLSSLERVSQIPIQRYEWTGGSRLCECAEFGLMNNRAMTFQHLHKASMSLVVG